MVDNDTEKNDQKEEKKPEPQLNGEEKAEKVEEFDYDKLLAKYSLDHSKFVEGEVIKGTVIGLTETEVIIDIGYKSEGIIPIEEFTDNRGNLNVKEGDEIEVLLEETEDPEGDLVLSKEKAELMKAWEEVEQAYDKDTTVKGTVVERIKGGLSVDLGVRAFLPGSLVDVRRVRDLDSFVGEELEMKVIKVSRKRNNIVLSRKAVLEEANAERKQKTLDKLEIGKVMNGVVKNITEYGAFIDLGGIDGLLHITDMSWGRVNHPSELFAIDDEVEVVILDYDLESERVSLGYKQKWPDPWEKVDEVYPAGKKVKGKVVSMTGYGAFVELEEGVEGLIHVSEMSWVKKIKHPSQVLSVGDTVETIVLDLDQENRRISLGLKQTEPNPWQIVDEKYGVGDKIEGKVRNLTEFGAFVELEEGIDGLVHISDMSWTNRIDHPSEVVKKGEVIKAVILDIDPESERISLGIKQLEPSAWDVFFENHHVGDAVRGKIVRLTDFGAFVELAEGVEGLVHVSELAEHRIDKPSDEFSVGNEISMKIIKLNPEEKKIGLSIRAYNEDQRTKRPEGKEAEKDGRIHIGDMVGHDPALESYRKEIEKRAKEKAEKKETPVEEEEKKEAEASETPEEAVVTEAEEPEPEEEESERKEAQEEAKAEGEPAEEEAKKKRAEEKEEDGDEKNSSEE